MEVYISNVEYNYFRAGTPCTAQTLPPKDEEKDLFVKILICQNEILKDIYSSRLLLQRKY